MLCVNTARPHSSPRQVVELHIRLIQLLLSLISSSDKNNRSIFKKWLTIIILVILAHPTWWTKFHPVFVYMIDELVCSPKSVKVEQILCVYCLTTQSLTARM